MKSTFRVICICVYATVIVLLIGRTGRAGLPPQILPPHGAAMNFAADYWQLNGKADGTVLNNPRMDLSSPDFWLDRISGAKATPFGDDFTVELNEFNGRPVVRSAH